MAAPTLLDYEYQYKDSGIKLNSSVSASFVDITKITGLDMPTVDSVSDSFDGVHGGIFYSKFFNPRTIVLDCDIYAPVGSVDSYCDTLSANFMPDDTDAPFYFKGAGIAQRYILCKSLGIKYDIDRLRAFGKTVGQISLGAGDPRKYIDNADITGMTAGYNYPGGNTGNMNTFPVITIVGAWTSISFINNNTAKTVTLTSTRVAGDMTVVNFKTRSVTVNGVRNSSIVTTAGWWDLAPGNLFRYTVAGGPPTSVTASTNSAWA
jgi:phage-related protein